MTDDNVIGRRVREIRSWRGLSLSAVAGLAGMSAGHLSNIERGQRRVDKRSTLEALAAALHVAPSELAASPFPPRDDVAAEARTAAGFVEDAVANFRLGDAVDAEPRAWSAIAEDLRRVHDNYDRIDYAAQGYLLPGLIEELHGVYATVPQRRTDALHALAACYNAAAFLCLSLGIRGVGQLAADRQLTVAERLAQPDWIAHAQWVRAAMMGGVNRERQAQFALRSIVAVDRESKTPELVQSLGQLHLTAALAYASMSKEDEAWAHFGEAEALANRQHADVGWFGHMYFGRANVDVWRVTLATEFGYGGRTAELAKNARLDGLPPGRQGEFYADLGRALAQDRRTRDDAVRVLLRAEDLIPQKVRNMPFVRETVTDLVQRAHGDAVGREVRGMAHRLGLTR